ncbi:hypothetical protein HBI56_180870 [Parastagonospora nodorum]|uniref:Uncharacterized protein n=1 Tax=Phaeosphaeria nodorum (strain SN15 / ATCC MYA-4574 / FGSC 10173) TaxID=321614 RepID=Q0TYU9_PHANO|nr:hypothetical protein SNOG_15363 [Parastagonospora nodorum SN15]KAH3907682.1 hypothetical protein HBH56_186250 [Parastagonospora nodorum]EAT77296.1 hypothetical protein SNOG_15363 [Parastagonospora nodorum SN15]KAH3925361.1 hypothetical protein HBH54_182310 [Parastagonospora nodorum]KAH3962156.1 hypothetical protein HBH52_226810 [Parastagonospora nodorum]KAH3992156.1 hypothetical protein HBI10_222490 [Parastagonospora nodorum]
MRRPRFLKYPEEQFRKFRKHAEVEIYCLRNVTKDQFGRLNDALIILNILPTSKNDAELGKETRELTQVMVATKETNL